MKIEGLLCYRVGGTFSQFDEKLSEKLICGYFYSLNIFLKNIKFNIEHYFFENY